MDHLLFRTKQNNKNWKRFSKIIFYPKTYSLKLFFKRKAFTALKSHLSVSDSYFFYLDMLELLYRFQACQNDS